MAIKQSPAGKTPLQRANTGWPTYAIPEYWPQVEPFEGQGYEEPQGWTGRDTTLGQKISEAQTLGGTSNPPGRFGSLGRSGSSGGYGKKRVAEDSRGQANLTGKKRSSILTS